VLLELATEHPLPGLLLDWRKVTKLKSTYVDSLGDLIHPETGRIHTDFNQTVAATGRLSSSNPNLQNIPVRTEMGREVRKAFVAREGWKLLSADYVQIELRILASMSGDKALTQDFLDGKDIHTATAARVFGIDPEDVERDQWRKAKEVNYGIPYGVSGWGLAQRLRSTVQEAQELIDQYQKTYPDISRYLVETVELAREQGYVETLLGRRRYVPGINARNRNERSFAERVAVNMPIQGTQADMIKIAMVRIHERMRKEGLQSKMLLQVHDELVFEVPPDEEAAMRTLIEEEMVNALPLNVPIEVDIDSGDNWLDAH
jgi:DNA polymerase-1